MGQRQWSGRRISRRRDLSAASLNHPGRRVFGHILREWFLGPRDRDRHRPHPAATSRRGVQDFLAQVDKVVPAGLDVHVVMDNSSTHKTPEIRSRLLRHPRYTVHFIPTSSSWLSLVWVRWFADLTRRLLKRSAHRSVTTLEADLRAWVANWNNDPRPFIWHKTADEILDTLVQYCQRISGSGH